MIDHHAIPKVNRHEENAIDVRQRQLRWTVRRLLSLVTGVLVTADEDIRQLNRQILNKRGKQMRCVDSDAALILL